MWRNPKYKRNLFNALKTFDELIIYDLETSGLSAEKDRIIQFAALKYKIINHNKLELIDECVQYINPGFMVSEKIEELTGITNEFLKDKPFEKDIFPIIKSFIGENACLCGYNNNKFDDKMMEVLYDRYNQMFCPKMSLDVFLMCRDIVSCKQVQTFKLCDLVKYFHLDDGISFHNALDDVKATGLLLSKFIEEYQMNSNILIKDTLNKPNPIIFSIGFWEGFSHTQARVYVSTNFGKVYYNLQYKYWENKDKDNDVINKINMEKLEDTVLYHTGLDRVEDLHKFKKIGFKKCY